MRGFGGLVTFLVKDADWRQRPRSSTPCAIPRIGPSLGGVESLIEQPLVMSYFECTPEERRQYGIPRQHDPPGLRHRKPRKIWWPTWRKPLEATGSGLAAQTTFGWHRLNRVSTNMQFRTRAIHVGNQPDPQTGAVVPPIHLATTFVQPGAGEWGEFDYSRSGNPTRKAFETTLADLEAGVRGPGALPRAWPPCIA